MQARSGKSIGKHGCLGKSSTAQDRVHRNVADFVDCWKSLIIAALLRSDNMDVRGTGRVTPSKCMWNMPCGLLKNLEKRIFFWAGNSLLFVFLIFLLFTSPGVYACGRDAGIFSLFSSAPFKGRVCMENVSIRPSPLKGLVEKMSEGCLSSTGVRWLVKRHVVYILDEKPSQSA